MALSSPKDRDFTTAPGVRGESKMRLILPSEVTKLTTGPQHEPAAGSVSRAGLTPLQLSKSTACTCSQLSWCVLCKSGNFIFKAYAQWFIIYTFNITFIIFFHNLLKGSATHFDQHSVLLGQEEFLISSSRTPFPFYWAELLKAETFSFTEKGWTFETCIFLQMTRCKVASFQKCPQNRKAKI